MSEVPKSIKEATLASEDVDFYNHGAIDYIGLARAAYINIKNSNKNGIKKISDLFSEENYSQGGSSITQQLVKNLYLSNEKSFDRKIREIVYSYELEKIKTKDQIFEDYLNNVYYGEQSLGIANAAKIYFGKSINDLNLGEISMLVGLPQAPSKLSPISGDINQAKERQKYVLSQMYYAGFISLEEAKEASKENLYYAHHNEDTFIKYPYFVNYVKDELKKTIGAEAVSNGGISVYTTIDPDFQEIAEKEAKRRVDALKHRNASNAAVVILDNDSGEIKTMLGGVNYERSKVNVAISKRQPGSSFKPIVYTTSLIEGYAANTVLHDKYTNFGGNPPYIPRNYNGGYMGNVTLRTALQNSLNIPAVEMTQMVGVDNVIETSKKLGITTIEEDKAYGLSIGLGTAEVKLIELTRAYSTLANLGSMPSVSGIDKIVSSDGTDLYIQPEIKKNVIDKKIAYIITNILSDNNSRGRTFGTSSDLYLTDRAVAAKTGTTDDYRNAWTVGYTPQYTVGVWVGNNDNSEMKKVSGLDGAAPIWNSIMNQIHKNKKATEFNKPEGIVERWINPYTGKPTNYYRYPYILEYFIPGTEPKKVD